MFIQTTSGLITLGTTPIAFSPFNSAANIVVGTGLAKLGNSISLADTTTAATKGSPSKTVTATVNAQGQLTSLSDQDILIATNQVSGLGTIASQSASNVAISGGSINNTSIGATTQSTGAFSYITVSNPASSIQNLLTLKNNAVSTSAGVRTQFIGNNSVSAEVNYGYQEFGISTNTNGSESGKYSVFVKNAGVNVALLSSSGKDLTTSGNFTASSITVTNPASGYSATQLNYYEDAVAATLSVGAVVSTPFTFNASLRRIGNKIVEMSFDDTASFTTSNAGVMKISGIPSRFLPQNSNSKGVIPIGNGSNNTVCAFEIDYSQGILIIYSSLTYSTSSTFSVGTSIKLFGCAIHWKI